MLSYKNVKTQTTRKTPAKQNRQDKNKKAHKCHQTSFSYVHRLGQGHVRVKVAAVYTKIKFFLHCILCSISEKYIKWPAPTWSCSTHLCSCKFRSKFTNAMQAGNDLLRQGQ